MKTYRIYENGMRVPTDGKGELPHWATIVIGGAVGMVLVMAIGYMLWVAGFI